MSVLLYHPWSFGGLNMKVLVRQKHLLQFRDTDMAEAFLVIRATAVWIAIRVWFTMPIHLMWLAAYKYSMIDKTFVSELVNYILVYCHLPICLYFITLCEKMNDFWRNQLLLVAVWCRNNAGRSTLGLFGFILGVFNGRYVQRTGLIHALVKYYVSHTEAIVVIWSWLLSLPDLLFQISFFHYSVFLEARMVL